MYNYWNIFGSARCSISWLQYMKVDSTASGHVSLLELGGGARWGSGKHRQGMHRYWRCPGASSEGSAAHAANMITQAAPAFFPALLAPPHVRHQMLVQILAKFSKTPKCKSKSPKHQNINQNMDPNGSNLTTAPPRATGKHCSCGNPWESSPPSLAARGWGRVGSDIRHLLFSPAPP